MNIDREGEGGHKRWVGAEVESGGRGGEGKERKEVEGERVRRWRSWDGECDEEGRRVKEGGDGGKRWRRAVREKAATRGGW